MIKRFFSEECAPLRWGVFFYALVNALDLASTSLGMRVGGLYENNPLMRDPMTLRFILVNGIAIKLGGSIPLCVVPAFFLYKGTGSHLIASLPFWYWGFHVVPIVLGNFLMIWTTF